MCGITGFYSLSQKWTQAQLSQMTQALRHRGPEAEGYFQDERCGLGHRRLKVIDLSDAANQPMFSHDERYAMVFNGEVYNFQEIAKKYDLKLKTRSDSEVILELFVKLKTLFVEELNGMFALAIYDRETQELYIYRDRLGIKPLFYYWDGQNFAFASETKALLKLGISREINTEALQDYLFLEYVPDHLSIFKHIQKLEKGHFLKISPNNLEKKAYYNLLDRWNPQSAQSLEHYVEAFDDQLTQSIRYRSISDVPMGAFLSGGTDSSLICAKFQELSPQSIQTYTIGFDVASFDESTYAQKVAEHLNTQHTLDRISAKESIDTVERMVAHYDEPFAANSCIPSLLVCQKAREKVTVALSGDGADELFMGYGYYHWYNRVKKISKYGGYAARKITTKVLSWLDQRKQRAARVFDYADFQRIWLHVWSQEQYMFSEKEVSWLLNKPYTHQSTWQDWKKISELDIHPFEKISLFDTLHYLPYNLLYKMDIASMASALEVRVPYLDHHLVEFALNVPLQFKIQGQEQKFLMKKNLEKYLPNELIYRKKWGFPAPVGDWLQQDLAYLIDKYLNEKRLKKQGLFEPNMVQNFVNLFRQGKYYHYKRVWALIVFQMWYAHYIDPNL